MVVLIPSTVDAFYFIDGSFIVFIIRTTTITFNFFASFFNSFCFFSFRFLFLSFRFRFLFLSFRLSLPPAAAAEGRGLALPAMAVAGDRRAAAAAEPGWCDSGGGEEATAAGTRAAAAWAAAGGTPGAAPPPEMSCIHTHTHTHTHTHAHTMLWQAGHHEQLPHLRYHIHT